VRNLRFILIFIAAFYIIPAFSQIGGNSIYSFLNLPNSARLTSMGGSVIAIKDNDLSLAWHNPSLLTKQMNNTLSLSFVDYFSDVNYGCVSFAHNFEKLGMFQGGIEFVDYGKFTEADATGQTYGEFNAADYQFKLGWGRQLDSSFSIGANLNNIYSHLEDYSSYGISVDVGATYYKSKSQFAASILALNIGRQLKDYTDNNNEPLPFELQLGISKKLGHAPFRFSIVARHLEKWDLTYSDPNNPEPTTDPLTGELLPEKKFGKFADKFMRHFIIGGELMPSKNFSIRFGYNYQRRQELQVESKVSTVGFSWGFGFRIKKFNLSYGRARYHLSGSPNHITLSTNLSEFSKK
jgi:hypothetical protein